MPSLEKLEIDDLVFEDFTKLWVRDLDISTEDIDTSDLDNPVHDDTYLGIDFHRGPTWTLDLMIEGDSEAEVLDQLDRVKAVWRNPEYVKQAGGAMELAFTIAGRRRIVYGRPRRFAPDSYQTTPQGYIAVLAEFKLSDPLQYDGGDNQGWSTHRLNSVPPVTRGLEESLTEDTLSTEVGGIREGQLPVVTGHAPTPFLCTIYGPISNPGFTIDGREYEFDTTLADGQRLNIDSRTGTVLLNGYYNRAHTMKRPTQLKNVRLAPGRAVEVSFFGDDPTLTAYAYFAFRPAHY